MSPLPSDDYFAGLFDGEGSFSIQVRTVQRSGLVTASLTPRASMTLKYGNVVLDDLAERFGGRVYDGENGKRRWSVQRRDQCRDVAVALLPYLRIKRVVAERFLAALDMWPVLTGVSRGTGATAWTPESIRAVGGVAATLNPSQHSADVLKRVEMLATAYEGV